MKQRLLIALFTIFGFAAGFGARFVTERDPQVPPCPAPGTEFARPGIAKAAAKPAAGISQHDREKFLADIEKMRPQIEAFHDQVGHIFWEFDRGFSAILDPDRRAKFEAHLKKNADKRAERQAKEAAESGPLTDQQIEQLRREPLWNALWLIAVQWRFERITREYDLTPEQQVKTRALLEQRRHEFIALVDSSEPPSLTYSELASRAQKLLAQPNK